MSMWRRPVTIGAMLVLGASAACGKDSAPSPSVPSATAGTLTVRLTSPRTDDAAILVVVSGPGLTTSAVTGASGLTLHHRLNGAEVSSALFGTIGSGELLRVAVPDIGAASRYSARIVEVSDRANALRADISGYGVSIGQ